MTPKPEDFLLQAWKQQLDIGLRLIETMVEGAIKMRQVQLEAATETYAKAVATRKSAAEASDLAQLVQLQAEWTRVNVQKCAAYWRDLYEVATRTQGELASRSGVQPPAAAFEGDAKQGVLRHDRRRLSRVARRNAEALQDRAGQVCRREAAGRG